MGRYEIEIKLKLREKEAAMEKLRNLGFTDGEDHEEIDTYFNSSFYNLAERGEALRLRSVRNLQSGVTHGEITYKGPKIDKISMSRMELESVVENSQALEAILTIIGMKEKYPVRKVRHYMSLNQMTACIDEVDGLGSFLELEEISESQKEREDILKKMEEILKQLGYRMEDTTRTSYLSMLQNKED